MSFPMTLDPAISMYCYIVVAISVMTPSTYPVLTPSALLKEGFSLNEDTF